MEARPAVNPVQQALGPPADREPGDAAPGEKSAPEGRWPWPPRIVWGLAMVGLLLVAHLVLDVSTVATGAEQGASLVVQRAFSSWDADELVGASSADATRTYREGTRRRFTWLSSRLGPMQSFERITRIRATKGFGRPSTATVVALAQYERGPAEIELELIQEGRRWTVDTWTVRWEALMGSW